MSSNIVNQVSYLRTSRNFPLEAQPLSVEINKSYIDIANAVNSRVIGIFSTNRPAITGESWFANNNERQQTLRQVYTFTSAGNIPHGINFASIGGFTAIYGTVYDGTSWYPLPYVNTTSATNQVSISVGPTNITIINGAGAAISIVKGFVVLEWLSFA